MRGSEEVIRRWVAAVAIVFASIAISGVYVHADVYITTQDGSLSSM